MVKSRIHEKVNFPTKEGIDQEDIGHICNVYEYERDPSSNTLFFTLGKVKFTQASKDLLYIPIYSVTKDQEELDNSNENLKYSIDKQIGLFEFNSSDVASIFDEDNNIDISLLDTPLFYEELLPISHEVDNVINDSSKDEWLPKTKTNTHIDKIFEIERNRQVFTLMEETEEDGRQIFASYKKSKEHHWVQRFFKNINYEIHATEENGDSFFAAIRDAFASIGRMTTVAKLRNLISEHVTTDHYHYFKNVCNSFELESKKIKQQLREIVNEIKQTKPLLENAPNLMTHTELIENIRELKQTYKMLQGKYTEMERQTIDEVGNETNRCAAKSLTSFRSLINKSTFPADEFCISLIEQQLAIKVLILKKEAYDSKVWCHVLKCQRHVHECDILECNTVSHNNPDFYVIMSYADNHYQLISYKSRHLFTFRELPFHVKQMTVMKCLEGNAGSFKQVDDFKILQRAYMNHHDSIAPHQDDSNRPILMYHKKCDYKAKPGMGDGERVPLERIYDFLELSSTPYWRRKLDDEWEVPISIDGREFTSVSKYMEYSKYKNRTPDYAERFSNIYEVIDEPNKLKQVQHVTQKINVGKESVHDDCPDPDPDFEERSDFERERALRVKFTENKELNQVLLNTKDSLLMYYKPSEPSKLDTVLMNVRDKIDLKRDLI